MQQIWQLPMDRQAYVWHAAHPRANLLLQHGYSEYAERFVQRYNQLIPRLLEHNISVYAFDMYGHGRSPGTRGQLDVNKAVQDHLLARRALAGQPLPLYLFGHSLGGLVTASSVALQQEAVAGVILTSPAIPQHNVLLRLLARALAAVAPASAAPLHPDDPSLLSRRPEVIEDATHDTMKYQGKLRNLVAATALRRNRANRRLYPAWKVPTLILHGTDDGVTDPRGSQVLFDAIASDDKTLHLVKGGFHELLNDTERDNTLQLILEWLVRHMEDAGGD